MTGFTRSAVGVIALLLLSSVTLHAETATPKAFDEVREGVVVVYNIDDLRRGYDRPLDDLKHAEGIEKILRDAIMSDQWTSAGGHGIADHVTPKQITIKASPAAHAQIAQLIDYIRASLQLYVEMDYQIVQSEQTPADVGGSAVKAGGSAAGVKGVAFTLDQQQLAAFIRKGTPVVGSSRVTVQNSEATRLVDGTDLPVPTIDVEPFLTVDRRSLTVALSFPQHAKNNERTVVSFNLNGALALRLGDATSHQWLLLTAKPLKRALTPLPSGKP